MLGTKIASFNAEERKCRLSPKGAATDQMPAIIHRVVGHQFAAKLAHIPPFQWSFNGDRTYLVRDRYLRLEYLSLNCSDGRRIDQTVLGTVFAASRQNHM